VVVVDHLAAADGGEVAVALVGEDDGVRQHALDAGGDAGRAPVRRLHHVAQEVVVGEHGATDGRDSDGALDDAQLVNRFRDQAVDDAVHAARAVVHALLGQALRMAEYLLLRRPFLGLRLLRRA
jgi:hypothetical protein